MKTPTGMTILLRSRILQNNSLNHFFVFHPPRNPTIQIEGKGTCHRYKHFPATETYPPYPEHDTTASRDEHSPRSCADQSSKRVACSGTACVKGKTETLSVPIGAARRSVLADTLLGKIQVVGLAAHSFERLPNRGLPVRRHVNLDIS